MRSKTFGSKLGSKAGGRNAKKAVEEQREKINVRRKPAEKTITLQHTITDNTCSEIELRPRPIKSGKMRAGRPQSPSG
jgi:hypothetical protein